MTDANASIRLKDVAQQAGVSLATASMALAGRAGVSDRTKRHVWQVSREMGYTRFRGRRSNGQSLRVGVVRIAGEHIPAGPPLHVFYDAVARGDPAFRIEYAATPAGAGPEEVIDHVLSFATGLDGLIVTDLVDRSLLQALHDNHVPHVVTGHVLDEQSIPVPLPSCVVSFDVLNMGLVAARYLLQRSHRHIGFICHTMPSGFHHDHWLRGFRLAHAERHQLPLASHIAVTSEVRGGVFVAVKRMLELKHPPTALVVPDGEVVPPVLNALERCRMPIKAADIVINVLDKTVQIHGLEAYPRFAGRNDLLVKEALDLLRRIIRGDDVISATVLVPVTLHNIE
jgi:DNA-binding LacI/PurR family transcriptional regulator